MKMYWDYYEKDRRAEADETIGSADFLEVNTSRGRVHGFVLTPNQRGEEKHPAVLMLHGFPGIASNHEVCQALRRVGFVVFNPYAPGSWGSGGSYSLDGNVDAACEVAEYVRRPEIMEKYRIEPGKICLLGHSMGGFFAANVLRRLDWLDTGMILAPCDIDWYYRNDAMDRLEALLRGSQDHLDHEEDLVDNADRVHEELAVYKAAEALKDKNLLMMTFERDHLPVAMADDLWERILAFGKTEGVRQRVILDTDHAFNDCKSLVAEKLCAFLKQVY